MGGGMGWKLGDPSQVRVWEARAKLKRSGKIDTRLLHLLVVVFVRPRQ